MTPFLFLFIENDEDRRFMENLYLEHHTLLYAQALKITRDGDLAQDVVSDSLVALMKKISLLKGLECNKLRSYLVITIRHTAISALRRGKREWTPGDVAFEHLSANDSVEDRLLAQAGVEGIRSAIRALPARERDLMLMKYFRELSDEEIAQETGLKAVSVRVHLSRARKHLAQLLGGKEEAQ